jgi:hypothetical protein
MRTPNFRFENDSQRAARLMVQTFGKLPRMLFENKKILVYRVEQEIHFASHLGMELL